MKEKTNAIVTWGLYKNLYEFGGKEMTPIITGLFPENTNHNKVLDILRDDAELEGEKRYYTSVEIINFTEKLTNLKREKENLKAKLRKIDKGIETINKAAQEEQEFYDELVVGEIRL